ncbi:MAG: hypothetical protein AB8G05_00005 [Oligoflexales bacterium]
MESSITYAKFILTTCTMLLTGSLLAFVNQTPNQSLLNTAPLKSVHWTALLSSVYNTDQFEKIVDTVNESSKNFESMVSLHSAARHRVTFLPQVHFIESFGPLVDKLAAEFELDKGSNFGDFIHRKILAAGPLEVNLLARVLEVYNSQLAIYDHLSTTIQSLGDGETITIFIESLQYTQLAEINLPTVELSNN